VVDLALLDRIEEQSVWSTSGETKCAAFGVSAQRTAPPARTSARTSSGTL
jgi:hypothetical protein